MPIPELVDYIRTQTQEGVTAEDLRFSLMEAGWLENDIDNALHDVAAGLHPATPGASIHEDLAQVRGMVAHLASRVKGVEAQLASFTGRPVQASLPTQSQLPTEFIAADHELSAPSGRGTFFHIISLVITVALSVGVGVYATQLVNRNALAPLDHLLIAAALGVFLLIASVVYMKRGKAWAASLLAAGGLALCGTDVFISWRVYHYMEWSVALGLALLFVVIAVVLGRWIVRLAR